MILDRKILWGIAASVLAMLLGVMLEAQGVMERFESDLLDLRHRYASGGRTYSPDIVVVDVDDYTLNTFRNEGALGRWPWKRDVWPAILEYIANGGPRAVLFDVYFTEAASRKEDEALARVPRRLEGLFLSHAIRFASENEVPEKLPPYVKRHAIPVTLSGVSPRIYDTVFYPIEPVAKTAPALHSVTYWTDSDGVSRLAEPLFFYSDSVFPLLPLRAFLTTLDPGPSIEWTPDSVSIKGTRGSEVVTRKVPLERGRFRIHYYSRAVYDAVAANSLQRIPVGSVIRSIWAVEQGDLEKILVQPDAFTNKIVIIGASASGTYDEKTTPHGSQPGYVLHTTMLSNLLEGRFLHRTPPVTGFLAAAVLLGVTVFVVLFFHRMIVRVLLPVGLFAAVCAASGILFYQDIAFYFAPVVVTFVPGFLAMLGVLTYFEGAEKRKFKGAMSKYLSPDVLNEVMARGELKAEVGHRKVLSVLFSDVRGFTTISESQDAAKVVEILNEYFSAMVGIIFETRGTLDKFIGDAIMAFWGAPIPRADHAELAVEAALRMIQSLENLNKSFRKRGVAPLQIGIGINTGEMIVGNIGSDQRLDYTLIGDNVNLGSRLESLTKNYGVQILISEGTHRLVWHRYPCRIVDLVAVKGKSIPVPVYEPILSGMFPGSKGSDIEQEYQKAFELYRAQRWDDAIAAYRTLAGLKSTPDTLADVMTERCDYFKMNQPPADWDGSFVMTSK